MADLCKKKTTYSRLNIIDVHLPFVSELERTLSVLFAECVGLIDFGILRKLAIGFH